MPSKFKDFTVNTTETDAESASTEDLQAPSKADSTPENQVTTSDADPEAKISVSASRISRDSDGSVEITDVDVERSRLATSRNARKSSDVSGEDFDVLRNGSASSDNWYDQTPSATSSRPASVKSSRSVKITRQEQELARAEYLQAQGYTLAFRRSSIEAQSSTDRVSISKVEELKQKLSILPNAQSEWTDSMTQYRPSKSEQPTSSSGEAQHDATTSRNQRSLPKLRIRTSTSSRDGADASVSTPAHSRFKLRKSFESNRALEASNWYTARGSRTLPHKFVPPEDLQTSSSVKSSRSASLRSRNDRLPPGYVLPTGPTSTIVASASVPNRNANIGTTGAGVPVTARIGNEFTEDLLESEIPLTMVGAALLLPNPDEDDAGAIPEPLTFSMTQLASRGQTGSDRLPPDSTDFTMSGGLLSSQEALTGDSQRNSRFSEVLEEVDGGVSPEVPPKAPDRPSAMNSTLLSNRNGVVWPIPEPATAEPGLEAEGGAAAEERKRRSWWIDCFLVALWAIVTAMTIFGIAKTSPLHQPTACTLKEVQTCMPPSFSFVHTLRLNTTLPNVLQPYLPSLQLKALEDLNLADHGLEVLKHSGGNVQEVPSGLVIRSSFADVGVNFQSDIIYIGVVDGDGDDDKAQRLLKKMMKEAKAGQTDETVQIVSAQGTSKNATTTREGSRSIGDIFLALWLACLLAVEMAALMYFAALRLLLMAAVQISRCSRHKREGNGANALREGAEWKREALTASALACRWILAGALGSATASATLIAFWV